MAKKYQRLYIGSQKSVRTEISRIQKERPQFFHTKSQVVYCIIRYMEPMLADTALWAEIALSPIQKKKPDPVVLSLTFPPGGKETFERMFTRLEEQRIFRSRGEFVSKLVNYFSTQKDIGFWKHVASWYIGRDEINSTTKKI